MYFTPQGLERLRNRLNAWGGEGDADGQGGTLGGGTGGSVGGDSGGGSLGGVSMAGEADVAGLAAAEAAASASDAGVDAALGEFFGDLDAYADALSSSPAFLASELAAQDEVDFFDVANKVTKALGLVGMMTGNPALTGVAAMGKMGLAAAEGLIGMAESVGSITGSESSEASASKATTPSIGGQSPEGGRDRVAREVDFDYQSIVESASNALKPPSAGNLNTTRSTLDQDQYGMGTYNEAVANLQRYRPDYY